jgi:hypothetical protein
VRADNGKSFLAQDAHDGGENAIVAGEKGGAADAGEDAGALGIGAEIEQGWAADGADEDELAAAMLTEKGEDAAGGAEADKIVGEASNGCGICEILESNYVNVAAGAARGLCNLAGQRAASCQDSQRFQCHAEKNLTVASGDGVGNLPERGVQKCRSSIVSMGRGEI